MRIREATAEDWPARWAFMRGIVEEGETFSWDRDSTEQSARDYWLRGEPAKAFVAVDEDGTVLGTVETGPNKGGGGAHIASGGFMVDPKHSGKGVGRALGEHLIAWNRSKGYRGIQFNAVVESNVRAVRLWKSLGFAVIATVPDGYRRPNGEYVGLHIMYKPLTEVAPTLANAHVATRLPAQDLDRARAFYADKLGLEPVEERDGGLLYPPAGGGEFALFATSGAPSGTHTQLAFNVDDLDAVVQELERRGLELARFEGFDKIAEIDGNYPSKGVGERGAWFRDSEGNMLGIGQAVR